MHGMSVVIRTGKGRGSGALISYMFWLLSGVHHVCL